MTQQEVEQVTRPCRETGFSADHIVWRVAQPLQKLSLGGRLARRGKHRFVAQVGGRRTENGGEQTRLAADTERREQRAQVLRVLDELRR